MKKLFALSLTFILAVFSLTACGKSSSIVGSWVTTVTAISSIDVTYTFNEDGTGFFGTSNVAEDFTYEISGNTVSITTSYENDEGVTEPTTVTYEYSVKGDTLTLVMDGSEVVFTKE